MSSLLTINGTHLSSLIGLSLIALALSGIFFLLLFLLRLPQEWRCWQERCTATLTLLAAQRIDIRPVLALLALWFMMIVNQLLFSHPSTSAPPTKGDLLFSLALQHGPLISIVVTMLLLGQLSFGRLFATGNSYSWHRAMWLGLRSGLALLPLVWLCSWLNQHFLKLFGLAPELQEAFHWLTSDVITAGGKLAIVLAALIAAPLLEEILFRRLLLPALSHNGGQMLRAILLSGLLFALLHNHLPAILPLTAIATGCSIGYLTSGHLLTPITMHLLINAVGLLAFAAANSAL